jgi:hypothetical protein
MQRRRARRRAASRPWISGFGDHVRAGARRAVRRGARPGPPPRRRLPTAPPRRPRARRCRAARIAAGWGARARRAPLLTTRAAAVAATRGLSPTLRGAVGHGLAAGRRGRRGARAARRARGAAANGAARRRRARAPPPPRRAAPPARGGLVGHGRGRAGRAAGTAPRAQTFYLGIMSKRGGRQRDGAMIETTRALNAAARRAQQLEAPRARRRRRARHGGGARAGALRGTAPPSCPDSPTPARGAAGRPRAGGGGGVRVERPTAQRRHTRAARTSSPPPRPPPPRPTRAPAEVNAGSAGRAGGGEGRGGAGRGGGVWYRDDPDARRQRHSWHGPVGRGGRFGGRSLRSGRPHDCLSRSCAASYRTSPGRMPVCDP